MPDRKAQTFNEVVTAAVADIVENGFDSAERIAFWSVKLREAAKASMISEADMERMLRDRLADTYRKQVDRGGLAKVNPGAGRFTIEKVRPQLRAVLDRAIMANASLIRLNRQQAVEKTIQRFQGWATSVPAGGSNVVDRPEVKANMRKALAQLPFEERRVLIDQGMKLTAALSEILAKDGHAIAATWHSHWRQAGYDARPDHIELDDRTFAVRGNWAIEQGLMKAGPNGYTDDIVRPAELPFCRCYYTWRYSLRDLPDDMMTAKGRSELKRVRESIAS